MDVFGIETPSLCASSSILAILGRYGFRKHLIDVVIEVDKSKAFFFHAKKFLRSQTLFDTKKMAM